MPADTPEDLDQWMSAARDEGDADSYQQVVRTCHHLVRATVLRQTADPDLADEIAQEVFVRGWLKRSQYRPGTSPRAWLLAITRNLVLEFQRRQARDNRHIRDLIRYELLRRSGGLSASEDSLTSRRAQALQVCMAKLSDEQRELLELVHTQGLRTSGAADVLGIQPATCRQRLSRIQRSLRRCAQEHMGEKR
jgi:RNA polymerase sigma-70 factor (ECF subfamily)